MAWSCRPTGTRKHGSGAPRRSWCCGTCAGRTRASTPVPVAPRPPAPLSPSQVRSRPPMLWAMAPPWDHHLRGQGLKGQTTQCEAQLPLSNLQPHPWVGDGGPRRCSSVALPPPHCVPGSCPGSGPHAVSPNICTHRVFDMRALPLTVSLPYSCTAAVLPPFIAAPLWSPPPW